MVDIAAAKRELGIESCKVSVIGTNRECKEVVLEISATKNYDTVSCITVGHGTYSAVKSDVMSYAIPAPDVISCSPTPL